MQSCEGCENGRAKNRVNTGLYPGESCPCRYMNFLDKIQIWQGLKVTYWVTY